MQECLQTTEMWFSWISCIEWVMKEQGTGLSWQKQMAHNIVIMHYPFPWLCTERGADQRYNHHMKN